MTIREKSQLLRWHDGILAKINIDQEAGAASLTVRPFGIAAEVVVVGRGVRLVSYTRTAPWGPSDFINSAIVMPRMGDEPATLQIEMQSGDTVTISAEAFVISEGL